MEVLVPHTLLAKHDFPTPQSESILHSPHLPLSKHTLLASQCPLSMQFPQILFAKQVLPDGQSESSLHSTHFPFSKQILFPSHSPFLLQVPHFLPVKQDSQGSQSSSSLHKSHLPFLAAPGPDIEDKHISCSLQSSFVLHIPHVLVFKQVVPGSQ